MSWIEEHDITVPMKSVYLLFKFSSPVDRLIDVFSTEKAAWDYVEKRGDKWDGANVEKWEVKV